MPDQIIRGDDTFFTWTLVNADGGAFDLTGCTLWFTAKTAYSNVLDDSDAVIKQYCVIDGTGTVTASSGLSLGGNPASAGIISQQLPDALTTTLALGTLVWEIQLKDSNGYIFTLLADTMTINQDLTRRTTTP